MGAGLDGMPEAPGRQPDARPVRSRLAGVDPELQADGLQVLRFLLQVEHRQWMCRNPFQRKTDGHRVVSATQAESRDGRIVAAAAEDTG